MRDDSADKTAVMLTLSGKTDAYGDIVRRYKDMLFGVIYAIVQNYHTAEDLTQDTFIDGFIKLKSLGEPYNIGAWLGIIAKNKSYNYLTRSAFKYENELHEHIQDIKASTPEDLVINQHERQALKQAIEGLLELYRFVVTLYYFDNYPQKKIAELLKIPVGTVSRRLYDAKVKLKKELGYMTETIKNVDFEKEIAQKIKSLRDYYHLNNFSIEGVDKKVDEFISFIDDMPESTLKHKAYAYAYGFSAKEELKSKALKEAEIGENADVYSGLFFDKYVNAASNERWLKAIDSEEGIAKIKNWKNSETGVGKMYFWRGACNMLLKNLSDARKDFEETLKRVNRDDSYHPNAVAAIKAIDILSPEYDKHLSGFIVTGERYRLHNGNKKLDFVEQPGFNDDYPANGLNAHSNFYFYASCVNNSTFFDLDMRESESDPRYYLHTPKYSHCGTKVYYYAPNVGIVKYECIWGSALYACMELSEYRSYATEGEYMPVYIGNQWIYDEVTIECEFIERMEYNIVSGMEDEFFMVCAGEMLFKGTEEEFVAFKKAHTK
jgi:RNA polymerase sigma factor (sigma-70 family)